MSISLLFDALLAGGFVWLAWSSLASEDVFRAIVLFVAFGLTMGLVWTRLGAIDLALAEIAVGAGLTGAILLLAIDDSVQGGADDEQD